ncbi:MAG: hypothetical protein L0L93_03535 [Brevibacterium sp.]|nr:hypothetical protein [Brevibacterium sp.]MDN6746065.1 hypothetical protein [Brevibacterium sp.]
MTDRIDAAFVRGGTDGDTSAWDAIVCSALGSPRQGVDLDCAFGQIGVAEAVVDHSGNCGNLSSGVVPFALLADVISAADGWNVFRLFNTNTGKLVDVGLTVSGGQAAVAGDFELTGVSGTGAPIELIYPDPSDSRTSGLLPTGKSSESIDANRPSFLMIEELRRKAAVRMGLCETPDTAPQVVAQGRSCDLAEADDSARRHHFGRGRFRHRRPYDLEGADSEVCLGTPSGTVAAAAVWDDSQSTVTATSLFRTARVLMRGQVAGDI